MVQIIVFFLVFFFKSCYIYSHYLVFGRPLIQRDLPLSHLYNSAVDEKVARLVRADKNAGVIQILISEPHNTSTLEADELQQQKNRIEQKITPVSQDQGSEAIMSTGSLKLDI